jgi:hypothetical protein
LAATDGFIAPKVVLPRSSSYSSEAGALGMNARANERSSEIMTAGAALAFELADAAIVL